MTELKRRSEADALRYVLQKIAEFPYTGKTAERQMRLLAQGALEVTPPEQPANLLQERESVRDISHRHCTCTCRDDPKVMQNHTNLCDAICDAILEYAVLSSAPMEQPVARKWTGPGHLEQTGYIDPEQPGAGCGDPSCKDPNCDYGKSRGLK